MFVVSFSRAHVLSKTIISHLGTFAEPCNYFGDITRIGYLIGEKEQREREKNVSNEDCRRHRSSLM